MSQDPLLYRIELGKHTFLVRDLEGTEQLSQPSRFVAEFVLKDEGDLDTSDFDPDLVVKQDVSIVMSRGSEVRRVDGIVTEASLTAEVSGAAKVMLVIEPRLSLLRHRRDLRVFRNQTVPEMVSDVASALGVRVELRLQDTYESRPYCVQLRETDLDYVHRLLEDEGIFYFFGEGDRMVLGDSPAAYDAIAGEVSLPFRSSMGTDMNEDAVIGLGRRATVTPSRVTLRDWNPDHPSLDMDVSAKAPLPKGPEWYDFPGEFIEPSGGSRKAKLSAEALACAALVAHGNTTCARMLPGATFKLNDAPHSGDDGEYVVTRVSHRYNMDAGGFSTPFEALRDETTFRPPRTTFVPRLMNPLTGIVTTSSPDEDIHCDAFGRVKVHFHFDRVRPYDDDCSHWIPTLQDNTGHSLGIPRKDWEVLVHYLEGDPDRPVVLGRVYNADDPFTEKLPAGKTRSGLKSMTTPVREGTNEIRFEDLAGGEHIFVHAEKDQNIRVANDRTEKIGNSENTIVKNDETIDIGNDCTLTIGEDMKPTVQGNQTWEVTGNRTQKIGASNNATVIGNRTLKVGGSHDRDIYFDDATSAKTMEEDITGSVIEKYKVGSLTEVGKTLTYSVTGTVLEMAKDSTSEGTGIKRKETISGFVFARAGGDLKMRVDKTRTTTVGATLSVSSGKELTLTGAEKFMSTAPSTLFDGSADITLKVGDTIVLLKGELIKINASDKISLTVSGTNTQGSDMSTQI